MTSSTLSPLDAPPREPSPAALLPATPDAASGEILDVASRPETETKTERRLRHRLRMEKAIAHISRLVVAGDASAFDEALAVLGAELGAHRGVILQLRPGDTFDGTHEWCVPGLAPLRAHLQGLDSTHFPSWVPRLRAGEDLAVPDIAALPPDEAAERAFVEPLGVRAIVYVPLVARDGALLGTMVFADVERPRAWSADDVRTLRVVGEMLAGTLQRLRTEAAVRASEATLRAIVENAAIGILLVDPDNTILETNPAFERLTGYSAAELRGRHASALMSPEALASVRDRLLSALASDATSVTVEHAYRNREGRTLIGHLTISRVVTPDGEHAATIVMAQDVTSRKALEAQLTHQAYHDALTDLANRALFRVRTERALALPATGESHVSMLFLDVDDFKRVNDSLGHDAGDELLRQIARRLLNATRGCDTVARLGGDEFAILLEGVRRDEDVVVVADRVIAALRAPFTVHERVVHVGASLGIAHARAGESADELLRNADAAMYRAKQHGKGHHQTFEASLHAAALERLELENDLRDAVADGAFHLVYQPIVDLASGALTSMEALIRWRHPRRGLVPPLGFIPLAEESGAIVEIGGWVLHEACREARGWLDAHGDRAPVVTVNVSARQLQHPGFVAQVRAALDASALPARLLALEITESTIMSDAELALSRLSELKALGVRLAIDDFGTGYSSLAYLQRFPVDTIKIDKSFVDGVARGGKDAALARTIIALGDTLDLVTIAEGIESEGQYAELQQLGCAQGQGYLFARPLAAKDAAAYLDRAGQP
jgi:diguanylate cyclase (GGDEF)-like protein/PAS domain S-box-containing protein